MSNKIKQIALDLGGTTFIESYRIQAYHGVIHYAQKHPEWRLVFNLACFSLRHKFRTYRDLLGLNIDGLIFLTWGNRELDLLRDSGLPAVSLSDTWETYGEFPCVLSNDFEIGREAADHFVERGFRQFAIVTSTGAQWERSRAAGFRRALAPFNPNPDLPYPTFAYEPALEIDSQQKEIDNETAEEMDAWLATLPKPCAIFATNDTRAYQVLEACKGLGIRVPHDMAIMGVDNNALICNSISPSLSSVEPNASRVGYEAAKMLDAMLDGHPPSERRLLIPPKGIVSRMSSDVMTVGDPAVAAALKFINGNLASSIGVDDIVGASGVSRSTLENRFRTVFGNTIHDEVSRQRLRRAKSLLLDTDLSIEEVGRLSGFKRATYFSSFFNGQTGFSPGAWRSHFKGDDKLALEQIYSSTSMSSMEAAAGLSPVTTELDMTGVIAPPG